MPISIRCLYFSVLYYYNPCLFLSKCIIIYLSLTMASNYVSFCLSINLSVSLFVCASLYLSVCLSMCLCVSLFVCIYVLSISYSVLPLRLSEFLSTPSYFFFLKKFLKNIESIKLCNHGFQNLQVLGNVESGNPNPGSLTTQCVCQGLVVTLLELSLVPALL